MSRILVITGTPGVGKTSVSSLIASQLQGTHIDLSDLVKSKGLSCGFDKNRETLIVDSGEVSKYVDEVVKRSEDYVVIDGHFAMDVVASDRVFLAFVLRRNPDELKKVLRERNCSGGKIAENVAAEILDVCLFDAVSAFGKEKVCEIDASGRSAEKIAEEVICVIEGRKKCRLGIVDWLTRLESEGRLDEFLKAF